ncbi:hypothetical protein TJA_25010 [Thermus sp. LT1-2-5]
MALSKPVLATPVGGNVEALGEGYPLFVRAPEQLARFIDDEGSMDLFASAGEGNRKRFVGEYTLSAMVERYLSLYEELC